MKIPWAIPNIQREDKTLVKRVIDSSWYGMGRIVKLFEEKMSNSVGRKYAIAVNNGTSALEVLMRALNISENDEVIVPALSFIASANAVKLIGAKPIFVDVDKYMNIDTKKIKKAITKKTKLIMAVDLTGNPCNYGALIKISKKYNIKLIVDGAQSLGSRYNGKSCLAYGIASTTSFHAAKIITTIEGGMIFTDNQELAKRIYAIRNHGESEEKYIHTSIGGNYRLTDVLAAFAVKQIDRFEKTLKNRKEKVQEYKIRLSKNIKVLNTRKDGNSCYFIFLLLVKNRDKLAEFLKSKEIETRKIYPFPIPFQPSYSEKGKYPIAERFSKTSLSLPLYEGLSLKKINYICKQVNSFNQK